MPKYTLMLTGNIRRDNDGGSIDFIPPGHPMLREFEAWKAVGNVPSAELPPPPVPLQVGFKNPEVAALAALLQSKGILSPSDVTEASTPVITAGDPAAS